MCNFKRKRKFKLNLVLFKFFRLLVASSKYKQFLKIVTLLRNLTHHPVLWSKCLGFIPVHMIPHGQKSENGSNDFLFIEE